MGSSRQSLGRQKAFCCYGMKNTDPNGPRSGPALMLGTSSKVPLTWWQVSLTLTSSHRSLSSFRTRLVCSGV